MPVLVPMTLRERAAAIADWNHSHYLGPFPGSDPYNALFEFALQMLEEAVDQAIAEYDDKLPTAEEGAF